jgi:hypothetical protein
MMARIINNTPAAVHLPTMHIVPKGGTLDTTNDVIRANRPLVETLAKAGHLTLVYDDETDADGETVPAPVLEPIPEAKAAAATMALLAAAAAESAAEAEQPPAKPARARSAEA